MRRSDVVKRIEWAMADKGIPQHVRSVRVSTPVVIVEMIAAGRIIKVEVPANANTLRLEMEIEKLLRRWDARVVERQVDLEDVLA